MGRGQLAVGTLLGGDYEVQGLIAEGGMGAVYACLQRSTREVRAVKVLSAETLVDEDLGRRFALECQVGARIRSEHVAKVIAAGVEGGRLPWIAMEFLEGETLTARVGRLGPLDHPTARALFAQLGHALEAAHAVQVAHRDLKPDNVFIARSLRADTAFTVKLLDFGIAKVRDVLTTGTTQMVFGTPFWMSPEQHSPGAAWQSADIWAVGLLAFYALTGRVYWLAAHHAALGVAEIFGPAYEPASARARALIGRDPLPHGFDAWFARCVALQPADRFASMTACLAAWSSLWSAASIPPTQPMALAPTLASAQNPVVAPPPPLSAPPRPASPASAPTERMDVRPPPSARRRASTDRGVVAWVAVPAAATLLVVGAALWRMLERPPSEVAPTTVTARSPIVAPRAEVRRDGECPNDMAWIAGGRVRLNDRSEQDVPGFCLERFEVRVSDYAACVAANGCAPIIRMLVVRPLGNVCNARLAGREAHPINCVKHDEAARYCAWRGRRLPRSSEWERAAEGSPARPYPWGEATPDATRLNACGTECTEREGMALSYFAQDPWPTTAPVGSFPEGATPDGVHDLLGNVSEWTADDARADARVALRGTGFLDAPVVSTRALRRVATTYVGRASGMRCAR